MNNNVMAYKQKAPSISLLNSEFVLIGKPKYNKTSCSGPKIGSTCINSRLIFILSGLNSGTLL